LVFGEDAARGQIVAQLQNLVGFGGARAIQGLLRNARRAAAGVLATAVGLGTVLLGATGGFGELRRARSRVWGGKPIPGRGWRDVVRERFLSFTVVLGTGFLLLVSLVFSAAVAGFGAAVQGFGPAVEATAHLIVSAVSFGVAMLLFALIFKV